MQVNDKNSQIWGLLSQAYDNNKGISGYPKESGLNSVFKTQEIQGVQGIESLFDNAQKLFETEVNDIFTLSNDFSNLRNFAKDFSQNSDTSNLNALGLAMFERGILSKEEKIGFDVLYKFNPSLDSSQTQNLLQNANLSQSNKDLLGAVDKKISAVRYFGNF